MRYMRLIDAARSLGVCTGTLRRWALAGRVHLDFDATGRRCVTADEFTRLRDTLVAQGRVLPASVRSGLEVQA